MRDENRSGRENEDLLEGEAVSLRQLNEVRLRYLNHRLYADDLAAGQTELGIEPTDVPYTNYQAPEPVGKPETAISAIQKKFSTSWLNMQSYMSERRQNRDWDQKFR